jgi:hypothetical protein
MEVVTDYRPGCTYERGNGADHTALLKEDTRPTDPTPVGKGRRTSEFMCGTKGGGKPIGLAGALPRERTLSGNVDTLEAHRCGLTLSGQTGWGYPQQHNQCPYLLSYSVSIERSKRADVS